MATGQVRTGRGILSPLSTPARDSARLRLICAAVFCAAVTLSPILPTAAAEPHALLLAQADQNAEPPSPPTPAPKQDRKPAPKPKAAPTPAKTPSPEPAAPTTAKSANAPATPPAEPTPKPPPSAAAEPQPVIHATNAGVKACLDGLVRASNATINTQHTAMSQWFTGAADSHIFQSIVSLAYPTKIVPHAAAILTAAPTASNGCDTSAVEVFPTARPCNDVLADLLKNGKVVADLAGLLVTQNAAGGRQLLMPSAGNGCVLVSVGLTFGK
jgi:hypothetical protein